MTVNTFINCILLLSISISQQEIFCPDRIFHHAKPALFGLSAGIGITSLTGFANREPLFMSGMWFLSSRTDYSGFTSDIILTKPFIRK